MATIQAYTKAKSDEIYDATVIDAHLDGDDLVLVTRDLTEINVGSVKGATGSTGATGATGAAGTNGVAQQAKDPLLSRLASTGTVFSADEVMGPILGDVPIVSGRTYKFEVEIELGIANFYSGGSTPRLDLWVTDNGALLRKVARYECNIPGADARKFTGSAFWEATYTSSTHDFALFADIVVGGAAFQRTDTEAHLSIADWGVL